MSDPSMVEAIFLAALAKATPAERAAYLDEACRENPGLRREVERLLDAQGKAGDFLEQPAVASGTEPGSEGDVEKARAVGLFAVEAVGSLVGPYKLLEQIGQGGMGFVWMAEQREPIKRLVAVKLIKPGMDSKAVLARFEAERQALALMDHPNIARVFDAGTTPAGRPFFAMELVKGLPLTDYCDSRKLSVAQRLDLFVQMCAAVQHAHQKGVIHRDLKPSNILVTEHDGRPVPKVIDFGLAKALNATGLLTDRTLHTAFGTMVGTPLYMAPEQVAVNALDVDTRADIYALGVNLYELLTGTTPLEKKRFAQAAWEEVQRLIREEEPPRPSARLSSTDTLPGVAANRQTEPKKLTGLVRGELDWIVMKALEKDRNRRYETVNELSMDVQRYLAGEPVLAHPPSPAYRMRKFLRRYKGPAVAASLVLLALLGGIAGTTWGLVRAEARRVEAEENEHKATTAEKAERAAKEESQKRLTQVEKANEILGSIFDNLDPNAAEKEGKPLQAILGDRLDQAVQQLEGEAVGDPLVVATLQNRLGTALKGLGHPLKAIVLYARALETRQAKLGRDHVDTLESMNNLATAYQDAGQVNQALPLYDEVFKLTKAKLGPDSSETLTVMSNLATAYDAAGMPRQALPLFEEALRRRKAKLGPNHRSTLNSMHNLGAHHCDARRFDQALPLLEETLRLKKDRLGLDHPDTLLGMNYLAAGYRAAGQLDRALPLYVETLRLQRARLGDNHPATLITMSNLGGCYRAASKLDRALPLYEEALKHRKAKLGADHPSTLISMNHLATTYKAAGKVEAALPLFEELLELDKARLGAYHRDTLNTQGNLAECYRAIGKLDKALPLAEVTLKLQKDKLGPDDPDTLLSMNNLAYCYHSAGKLDRALPLYEETLKAMNTKLGPDHSYTLTCMGSLADAYLATKQLEKAVPLLATFLAGKKKHHGPESTQLASIQGGVARELLKHQQVIPAEPILRECLAIRQKHEPDVWTTFNIQSMLGGALLGQQKYADAEPLLVQGYEGMKQRAAKIPPQGKVRLAEALDRLVQLYTAWGKPDEALKWFQELEARKAGEQPPRKP